MAKRIYGVSPLIGSTGLLVEEPSDPDTGGAGLGPDEVALKFVTVTLTDAQIKALPTTSVEIVPAPGSGKRLLYFNGIAILDTTAGVYGNVGQTATSPNGNAAVIKMVTPNGAHLSVFGVWGWLLEEATIGHIDLPAYVDGIDSVMNNPNVNDSWSDYATAYDDQPIHLASYNGAQTPLGDYTNGNAANTLKVTVFYTVVDL